MEARVDVLEPEPDASYASISRRLIASLIITVTVLYIHNDSLRNIDYVF